MKWCLIIAMFLLLGCEEKDTREKLKEIPLGYTGKARINPYLAAELYLKKQGADVSSSRVWSSFDEATSVVFMPVSFLTSKGMGVRVLDWVAEGGMLVLTVEGGEPGRNDFWTGDSGEGEPFEGDYPGMDYVFQELEVGCEFADWSRFGEDAKEEDGHLSRSWHVTKFDEDWEYGDFHLEQEGEIGLSVDNGWSWDHKEEGVSRLIGVYYGDGEVMVMAHARPLRSPYLARADHAKFLRMISEYYGGGEIVFLYGAGDSFLGLLWKKGWMVVVAGLVLLVVWLWMRIPRFGPVLEDPFKKPKPYGESLTASARFLWRRGQVEHYLRPLRARIEQENEGDPETLYERLAENSNLDREEVARALMIDPPKDPGHVLKVVQKIQALLKR